MRILNSLLAPSILIIVAGIAFWFYTTPYIYDRDPDVRPFLVNSIVIYPEREFGLSLILSGSVLTTLIVPFQTVLSRSKRHQARLHRSIIRGESDSHRGIKGRIAYIVLGLVVIGAIALFYVGWWVGNYIELVYHPPKRNVFDPNTHTRPERARF
jgi:hypothetical protein